VRFLKGWFRDTLPSAPVKSLAVLRLDGDLYESTIDALTHLYPKLEKGGYAIIDDYGSVKAQTYAHYPGEAADSRFKSRPEWDGVKVTCYDPGYTPFSGPLEPAYDGVICTDVLEHITEEDIPWVLDKLFRHARQFVYAVAACYPARKQLPDGQNAHCTLQEPTWWREQMEAAARRVPGVKWQLCARVKGPLGKSDRVFRG